MVAESSSSEKITTIYTRWHNIVRNTEPGEISRACSAAFPPVFFFSLCVPQSLYLPGARYGTWCIVHVIRVHTKSLRLRWKKNAMMTDIITRKEMRAIWLKSVIVALRLYGYRDATCNPLVSMGHPPDIMNVFYPALCSVELSGFPFISELFVICCLLEFLCQLYYLWRLHIMINIESQNAMHSYRATKFHSWHDIHIQKKK